MPTRSIYRAGIDRIDLLSLEPLFRPASVAIIGASSDPGKIGGIPLKLDGKVVGAIGVSGGSGEQDHAVAAAGAAAF